MYPKVDRLQREVDVLKDSKINHPNIVKLIDVLKTDSHFYFVYELIEGQMLSEFLGKDGKGLELKDLQYLSKQLVLTVVHLHENDIVHRDLKPDNIMVTKEKNVKVIDFG